jgi:hypothetical protein
MDNAPEFISVFRSEGRQAREDAAEVREQLAAAGLDASVYEEKESGAWEVRVPEEQGEKAGQIISVNQPDWASPGESVDTSSDFDQVTIYVSETALGEMEAMSIKSLLNAAGIPAFIVGTPALPVFSFQVQVAREQAEEARKVVREAQEVGAQGADEAERAAEDNA